MKIPDYDSIQYTVKRTCFGGVQVLVRHSVPATYCSGWEWTAWKNPTLSQMEQIMRLITKENKA